MPIEFSDIRPSWWKELWWKERGPVARVLCLLGKHAWRYNTNGWTNEDFLSCNRCMESRDYKAGEQERRGEIE